jgi:hypothetical protein
MWLGAWDQELQLLALDWLASLLADLTSGSLSPALLPCIADEAGRWTMLAH